MKNPFRKFWTNRGKIKEFYIGTIAAIFAAIPIGIIIEEIKQDEPLYNLFISLGAIVVFILLWFVGIILIRGLYGKQNEYAYYVNYLVGFVSAAYASIMIKYHESWTLLFIITTVFIVIFIIIAYFHTGVKRQKK